MSPETTRFTLAVMYDASEEEPPSSLKTIQKLIEIGKRRRVTITCGNFQRLQELNFDALFIRQTTLPGNDAHKLACLAELHKIPVIDDPASIEASCDKLEMAVRFASAGLPTPLSRSLRIKGLDKETFRIVKQQIAPFGYPIVIKDPASSFSRGVFKAENEHELHTILTRLKFTCSHVQAQEFVPTRFDWRIGVLNNRAIYCCQYNMVPGHWQVIKNNLDGTYTDGSYVTLRPGLWPQDICSLAVRAASCVGTGLYGVDIKETKHGPLVIEVNDNPSIDIGEEDKYGNVWEPILEHFRRLVSKGERLHYVQDPRGVPAV